MINDGSSWLEYVWNQARTHDLPNWFTFLFAIIVWPLVIFFWQRRKVNGIPELEVRFAPGNITIAGKPYVAIDIRFTNHTGVVINVSGVRIRDYSRAFPIPVEADRDIAENSYHLKFLDSDGRFTVREVALQTGTSAKTCMPVFSAMPGDFFNYSPPWYARWLRLRKYFVLEYTAMVGTTGRRAVATLH